MKKKLLLTLLVTVLAWSAGLLLFKLKNNKTVLAKIKGTDITIEDFEKRIQEIPEYYQGFLTTEVGRRELLDAMITEAVLIQKAKEEGLDKKREVRDRLKKAWERVLLEAMVQNLMRGRASVSDEEVRDYWEKNRERYENPREVRLSHILVKTKQEAENVLQELNKGVTFEKLAQDYSVDSLTAFKGGDLGYISPGDMIPEFEEAVFSLKNKGDTSGILKTPFGYHIIRVTDVRELEKKSQQEIESEIRTKLQNEKLDRLVEKYKKELVISTNYDLLSKVITGLEPPEEGESRNENQKKGHRR